jgi:rubrerythrin
MNTQLFDSIAHLDSETASPASRRTALQVAAKEGGKLALGLLVPLAAAGCAAVGKVVAPDTGLAKEVLTFAIMLEELEHAFYVQALNAPGLIPARDRVVFEEISKHEGAHVTFLTTGLTGIGGIPDPAPKFNFNAGGHHGVFSNYESFLSLAQTFEETGVGAYKGQATNLITSNSLLTAALRIHSVEARHAAEIRRLRGEKPWTGAFDQPLSKKTVLERVSPFIVKA